MCEQAGEKVLLERTSRKSFGLAKHANVDERRARTCREVRAHQILAVQQLSTRTRVIVCAVVIVCIVAGTIRAESVGISACLLASRV